MISTVEEARLRFNKKLKLLGLLANRVNLRSNAHKEALMSVCESFVDIMIQKTMGNRIAIQEALDQGLAVWDFKTTTAKVAAKEMQAIIEYIEMIAKESVHEHV